ncbi:putative E3 ubiquitin-protein ligase LIN-2, partial [Cucurbita argyrosperma subsp. argyrosperma]
MASSLKDLLAEEGFRARRPLRKSKGPFKSHATNTSNDHCQKSRNSVSDLGGQVRSLMRPSPHRHSFSGDNFTNRDKMDKKLSNEYVEILDGKRHGDVIEQMPWLINLAKDKPQRGDNIISEEENENFKDLYSNEMHIRHGVKGEAKEKKQYEESWSGKDINAEIRQRNSLKINGFGRTNFQHINSAKFLERPYYHKSNGSASNRKSFEDNHSQARDSFVDSVRIPALDVAAIQAVISIINGYLKYFFKDKDFRSTLRHNSFSLLNFIGVEGRKSSKVVTSLEQAIDVVEKAAEGLSTEKDLKRALWQLSMIAGLNTNALKDGFTSEISNSKLSALAHLYLGLIFKKQKKENSSAKHILQVFFGIPYQARIILFPELWDYLFLPHLSHIKSWYDREVDSLVDTSNQSSNHKLLVKVYNETLDSGTCEFAVYYKDWLTGIEAPAPSIVVPSVSFEGVDQGSPLNNSTATTLPNDFVSSNLMVSKKLYDAMFASSRAPGAPDTESEWESENLANCVRSSNSSSFSKHTQIYYSDTVKDLDQATDEDSLGSTADNTALFENCKAQEWKMYNINILSEMDNSDEFCSSTALKKNDIDFEVMHAQPYTKESNYSRQKLAQPCFEVRHSDASEHFQKTFDPSNFSDASFSSLPIKVKPSVREPSDSYESSDERSFFLSIPKDFICPLTGQLYEDPVTLETGQSFEKTAIKAWLDQGHRTCPVTGKKLETLAVPLTNFVLKRVIKNWNSYRRANLLAFLSQRLNSSGKSMTKDKSEMTIFMLEQFLTACGNVEATENAKYLIGHGYLGFLIQLFESGNLEEKTSSLALLSRCIEADGQCRYQIANEISKSSLVNLLHSKHVKSLESVMQLLTKLICLERRKDVTLFLSSLLNEDSEDTLHAVLVYLRSSPPEQRPLVAVLLMHFNLVVESLQHNMYMEEAVDAIIKALDDSLTNEKIRESCCRAILTLGGHFSLPEKFGSSKLNKAGFINPDYKEEHPETDSNISLDDEKQEIEEWRRNLSLSLMKSVKQSFFVVISKCLTAGSLDLVGVGLSTLTWLCSSLPLLSAPKFHPSALTNLICLLKDNLQNSMIVEHKILASTCLLNLSKIAECRLLVIAMSKEIEDPLRSIGEISQTAKQLYGIVTRRGDI